MRRVVAICGASATLAAIVTGTVVYWRRNPRVGTRFVNAVVNPGLVRRGLAGGEKSELGTIEHVGRKSGIRRLTPVHPEPTPDGFRIVVPLGQHSEWARNVLAAGHCRLQLHERVYELDEPALIQAGAAADLPGIVRGVMQALGFQYLTLRTFAVSPGTLEPAETPIPTAEPSDAPRPVAEASFA
jgi:deazaflavin-dependent oxidoreductase (nitroreductase family)